MLERCTEKFGVLQKIYNGEIMYCDKKPINKKVNKLFSEVAELWEKNDTKAMEELIGKYTEIISLLEIEAFARGVAFMKELREDINKVLV